MDFVFTWNKNTNSIVILSLGGPFPLFCDNFFQCGFVKFYVKKKKPIVFYRFIHNVGAPYYYLEIEKNSV